MNMNETKNNQVTLIGKVNSSFTVSHEMYGKKFYQFEVAVKRKSTTEDIIPCMIPEETLAQLRISQHSNENTHVKINGFYRSFNQEDPDKQRRKLLLSVFVTEIEW